MKKHYKYKKRELPANIIHEYSYSAKKLKDFCEINNLYLHIWTVNNDEDFDKCLEFGCDGIMTDEPLKLRTYLERNS